MMVTFVCECEKKALPKTRRVLDAFANRIGSRTWQTVITLEGLDAVKKLLRKTASKNTAVSCHWIRSRSRSELVWIVGNRGRFDMNGNVPVNSTRKTIMNSHWENDWHYLPLIKALSALAALFHDWGKASEFFQDKLVENKIVGDPLRHEWISLLFLNAYVNGESDEQWLQRLIKGDIDSKDLKPLEKFKKPKAKPFIGLPDAASMIAWLVVSHHRLPCEESDSWKKKPTNRDDFKKLFGVISETWGYENRFDEADFKEGLSRCFTYSNGLPSDSKLWLTYTKRTAQKLFDCLPLLESALKDGSWRLVLNHARLALMLGDHYYSSQDKSPKWKSDLKLYANTDRDTKALKQQLDEHLVGVAKQAVRTAHLLPAFESNSDELQRAYDVKALKEKSPNKFRWQDTAVTKIAAWRCQEAKQNPNHFGFFAVNMASTGKGKTFANGKIMRALSPSGDSLRFILALGLRTLTLQTGDEYRHRIKLEKDELAVLIGSRAVLDLHNKNKDEDKKITLEGFGSESLEALLDNEIDFETTIPEGDLQTVLTTKKDRQFLHAPVLSCTIDHMMAATETRRGGRYILPTLRLMSSDLVIDEIDDFDGTDLIAIGRLIHLAGMLGRKVMISSATIPPDLAEGYYNAYQSGWSVFAKTRDVSPVIGCAWVDEFRTQVTSVNCMTETQSIEEYSKLHCQFVTKRVGSLNKQPIKRKAEVFPCEVSGSNESNTRQQAYKQIQQAILKQHEVHVQTDATSEKAVSFGVVRVANITPCIEFTRYLLNCEWPDNVEVRTMAYHSQQILLMRSDQEKHLDEVLKRSGDIQEVFKHPVIKKHLDSIAAKNVIFILVATPVEEVGRDHDFDWAVVEPSSYRSLIQLAGRVLRHRDSPNDIEKSNIALMQYNFKGLSKSAKPVFCRPGYESESNLLKTHDLNELVDLEALRKKLDAQPRISRSKQPNPENNLADLEHEVIHQLLTAYEKRGAKSMQGWLSGCWWLTGLPQYYIKFREGDPQVNLYLIPNEETWCFAEKGRYGEPPIIREQTYRISRDELTDKECERLWLHRDYEQLLNDITTGNIERAALIYGEIGLPVFGGEVDERGYVYSSQLGLVRGQGR